MTDRQTLITTGIEDAVAAARKAAGDKDVALMGGGVVTAALTAGLVDELVLHQVPVLLGAGRRYFRELPGHLRLRLVETVPAPGVTTCTTRSSDDPDHLRPCDDLVTGGPAMIGAGRTSVGRWAARPAAAVRSLGEEVVVARHRSGDLPSFPTR
jgi:hypothetical protein